jgi:hypothetical protein
MQTTEHNGAYYYPLNIQGNRSPALKPFLTFLKLLRLHSSLDYRPPAPEAVFVTSHSKQITT